jgi:hypothetical protein
MVLQKWKCTLIFTSVFHRILDFKAGLNVYSDPFFFLLLSLFFTYHFPSNTVQHRSGQHLTANPDVYSKTVLYCGLLK